jgi:hypothetical protein
MSYVRWCGPSRAVAVAVAGAVYLIQPERRRRDGRAGAVGAGTVAAAIAAIEKTTRLMGERLQMKTGYQLCWQVLLACSLNRK